MTEEEVLGIARLALTHAAAELQKLWGAEEGDDPVLLDALATIERHLALTPKAATAQPVDAVEAAAKRMWAIWGFGGNGPVAKTWDREGEELREIWRTYARAALALNDGRPA